MERLTKPELVNGIPVCYPNNCSGLPEFVTKGNPYRNIVERLKAYEDLEEQGKLLKLPCAVGGEVYGIINQTSNYDGTPYRIVTVSNFRLDMLNKIGKTVFLTRQEAEDKLEEMEGKK